MNSHTNWANTYQIIRSFDLVHRLPHETVIRDNGGDIMQRDDGCGKGEYVWFLPGITDPIGDADIELPVAVIYAPEASR